MCGGVDNMLVVCCGGVVDNIFVVVHCSSCALWCDAVRWCCCTVYVVVVIV